MTTEDAFQALLDAEPDNHTARLIFADWLDEQGDPRGPGYRALGANRRYACDEEFIPCPYMSNRGKWCWSLPTDWFDLVELAGKGNWFGDEKGSQFAPCWELRIDATRREVEDAAALAFAKLPEARQAELLASRLEAVEAPV